MEVLVHGRSGELPVLAIPAAPPAPPELTVTDPRSIAPHLVRALVAAGADVVSITESRHSLEDVYLQLIDEDPEASRR